MTAAPGLRRRRLAAGALVAALTAAGALSGCSDLSQALAEDSSCPGSTCEADTRARVAEIAALDGVTEVVEVTRRHDVSAGTSVSAVVHGSMSTDKAARGLAMEVLRILDVWPGHETARPVSVTVVAQPARLVPQVATLREEWTSFDPCTGAACVEAEQQVRTAVRAELPDLSELRWRVAQDTLRVSGHWQQPDQAEEANPAAQALIDAIAVPRVLFAHTVEVRIRYRAPRTVVLELADGRVCEQAPGFWRSCEDRKTWPLDADG